MKYAETESQLSGYERQLFTSTPVDLARTYANAMLNGNSLQRIGQRISGYLKMDANNAIVAFQGKNIRRTWFNEEWWFVATDVVAALTDSADPSGYLKDMRRETKGSPKGGCKLPPPFK